MIKVQLDQGPAVEMDAGVTVFRSLKKSEKNRPAAGGCPGGRRASGPEAAP